MDGVFLVTYLIGEKIYHVENMSTEYEPQQIDNKISP